jgi:hypothetical protein
MEAYPNYFKSLFDHPDKGIWQYSCGGKTLASETTIARGFDGNPNFGRLLYSRPVSQVLMQMGHRYELRTTRSICQLQYRNVNEDLFSPYDYFRSTGDLDDKTLLLVQHSVPVPGLNINATVTLKMELAGTITHKFSDLCKQHYFEVSLSEGKPQLLGYKLLGISGLSEKSASISIPLQLLPEPNRDAPIEDADAPQTESAPAPVG